MFNFFRRLFRIKSPAQSAVSKTVPFQRPTLHELLIAEERKRAASQVEGKKTHPLTSATAAAKHPNQKK